MGLAVGLHMVIYFVSYEGQGELGCKLGESHVASTSLFDGKYVTNLYLALFHIGEHIKSNSEF